MDIRWIEDFLCLIKTRNFSDAAKQRFVTQSAYSRRIKALEIWLKVDLFDRSSHPIMLTKKGGEFLPHAEKIRDDLRKIEQEFNLNKDHNNPEIRILTLHTLTLHFLPRLLTDFDFQNSKITVTSNLSGVKAHYDHITNGLVDVFICFELPDLNIKLEQSSTIKSHIISSEKIIPVFAAHLQKEIKWDSREKIPFLSFNNKAFIGQLIKEKIACHMDKFNVVYETNVAEALLQMVRQGKGVAWLPYSVCAEDLKSKNLVILEGPDLTINCNIMAYINTQITDHVAHKFWTYITQASITSQS